MCCVQHTGAIPVQPTSPTTLPTRIPLHVGVLHYSPTQEPFPLLADPERYGVLVFGTGVCSGFSLACLLGLFFRLHA
jgi:hypothetical protein